MYLWAAKLKHSGNYEYKLDGEDKNEESDKILIYPAVRFTVRRLTVYASIFAPLKVVAEIYDLEKVAEGNLIPYYSILGFCFINELDLVGSRKVNDPDKDMGTRVTKLDIENLEGKSTTYPTCLICNRVNSFVPFVLIKLTHHQDTDGQKIYRLFLLEKRAFSLALEHKFTCISQAKDKQKAGSAKGLLSIPEIIEELSVVQESEDGNADDVSIKNIVNFSSAGINRLRDNGPTDPKEQTEHCAFLSRFVAPASQSRLNMIYSLARKYGYGLVYRPRSKQYYAIDLLGDTTPGRLNGHKTKYYDDIWTFDDRDDAYFFGEYGVNCNFNSDYLGDPSDPDSLRAVCANDAYTYVGSYKSMSPDFLEWFYNHIAAKMGYVGIQYTLKISGFRNYQYLSRYAPFSSISNINKVFDSTVSLNTSEEDIKDGNLPEINLNNPSYSSTLFTQGEDNKYLDGAMRLNYEDQVALDFAHSSQKREEGSAEIKISSVNERLNLANYKIRNMQNNQKAINCQFYSYYAWPSGRYNLTYEFLSRLGYFNLLLSDLWPTAPIFKERVIPSPSGFSFFISQLQYRWAPNKIKERLLNIYQHDPCDAKGGFLGLVEIRVVCNEFFDLPKYGDFPNNVRGYTYSIDAELHFYPDAQYKKFTPTVGDMRMRENGDNEVQNPEEVTAEGSPEPPQMPVSSAARAVNSANMNSEFNYNGKHYSYDNSVIRFLRDYILKYVGRNEDFKRSQKDNRICLNAFSDPLLLVRTYMSYNRFNTIKHDFNQIDYYCRKYKQAAQILKDPAIQKAYDNYLDSSPNDPSSDSDARGYHIYRNARQDMNIADEKLRNLSKTPVGRYRNLREYSDGEGRYWDYNPYANFGWESLEDPSFIPQEEVSMELDNLENDEYVAKKITEFYGFQY